MILVHKDNRGNKQSLEKHSFDVAEIMHGFRLSLPSL
ncbi:hypothetical protein D8815_02995 [Streptococcus gordonii]|nr:hypothetical protein D8816_08180 [Streptococcus gordonii]RSJ48111.1 hypothetical protein D8815_02995 [Streptococcus gordonii]RSJ51561.1 hypothetical protein D8813_04780 [Streptococcus gordonii]